MQKYFLVYKKLGETPLQALERFRVEKIEEVTNCNEVGKCDDLISETNFWKKIPMTYAGRLDPMAEGELIVLVGEECKKKDKYLGLDKEYEVEVLFGINTDTSDILGIPDFGDFSYDEIVKSLDSLDLNVFVGKFTQEYPIYSSKTVNGKQLHQLARAGELPEELPKKDVEIYSIGNIEISSIGTTELKEKILSSINLVNGDFRQELIKTEWQKIFEDKMSRSYIVLRLRVKCSSGTYMRVLAKKIGESIGLKSCALSIRRNRFFGLDTL